MFSAPAVDRETIRERSLNSNRNNELGSILRASRGRQSIEAMAARLEVNKNTLGAYERGTRLPDIDFLVRFSQVTGIDLVALLNARIAAGGSTLRIPADPPSDEESAHSTRIDEKLLETVVAEVVRYLEQRGLRLAAEREAALITTIYALALREEGDPMDAIANAIQRLSKLLG